MWCGVGVGSLGRVYKSVFTFTWYNMPANPDLNDKMFVTSGVALVAHAAYHLGAIRQMIGQTRDSQP